MVEDSVKRIPVTALETDPPVVVEETTPLGEVLDEMAEKNSGCALVTRQGRLTGIFTECYSLMQVLEQKGNCDDPVSEWMTPDPVTVRDTEAIRRALYHMRHDGHRNVPVVDADGKVVSCVRLRDILRFVARHMAPFALNLPPDPDQVATAREGG